MISRFVLKIKKICVSKFIFRDYFEIFEKASREVIA